MEVEGEQPADSKFKIKIIQLVVVDRQVTPVCAQDLHLISRVFPPVT